MAALMKDGLDRAALRRIASSFQRVDADFASDDFVEAAHQGLEALELKQRVHHIIEALHGFLPQDFAQAAPRLDALKEHWDWGDPDDSLRGFAAWPVIDYVARYGLSTPQLALPLLRTLTPLFSAEFAIRPFLLQDYDGALPYLERWCEDPDEHVRRLVSEGTRTRLPWGMQLKFLIEDPQPILPLLEALKDDDSLYVRRSVANNLNDLSKDHPALVLARCEDWLDDATDERQWIVRHATRTLVKSGHPEVFPLLGFTPSPEVDIALDIQEPAVALGDTLCFDVSLESTGDEEQRLVLDYALHLKKANGKTRPKVFKLKNLSLAPGECLRFTKRHSLRKITTRTYYPGEQAVELQINGVPVARQAFELLPWGDE